jgi:hypothetical protein
MGEQDLTPIVSLDTEARTGCDKIETSQKLFLSAKIRQTPPRFFGRVAYSQQPREKQNRTQKKNPLQGFFLHSYGGPFQVALAKAQRDFG